MDKVNILTLPRTGSTYVGWLINYHLYGKGGKEWIEFFDNPNSLSDEADRDFYIQVINQLKQDKPSLIKTHQHHMRKATKVGLGHKVRSTLREYKNIVLLRKDFWQLTLSHALAQTTDEWKYYTTKQVTIDPEMFKATVVTKWDEVKSVLDNEFGFNIHTQLFYEDLTGNPLEDFALLNLGKPKFNTAPDCPYSKAPNKEERIKNISEIKEVYDEMIAHLEKRDNQSILDSTGNVRSDKRVMPKWKQDGSLDPDSPNKTFCMAPWTHTYLSPQGERRMCCASREEHSFQKQYIDATNDAEHGEVKSSKTDVDDFNPSSLEEHWNSPYMRNIRKKLMAGETLPQCQVCNEDVLSVSAYRKWFTGVLFQDKIEDAFRLTDNDGKTDMPVISFDYRYSNLCNFKCRMCGEQLSSSWEAEKRKHDLWTKENQPFMQKDVKSKMQTFQKDVAEPEFKKAISDGIVEEIYWVGGEPLMYDIHWWALDEMVKNGSAQKCHLRYNTNLSRTTFKNQNLYDYLPKFKDWLICASIDGTGDIVEFIRKGIVWEEWLDNFKAGLKLPGGQNKMVLDLTITGPGMFSIIDLVDLALELDVSIETKIMFAFHPDIVFSPFAWPRHILDRHIDRILDNIESRVTHKQMSVVNTLKEMKNRQTFQEKWPKEAEAKFRAGRKYQETLDRIRQEQFTISDIYKNDPELYEWWNRDIE